MNFEKRIIDYYAGKTILVAGGAGMIGSNLTRELVKRGSHVVIIDNLWRGKIDNLKENNNFFIDIDKDFVKADLTDMSVCLKYIKNFDLVYDLADIVSGINFVFNNQSYIFRQNILMNSNVITAAIENGVKNYVYVGSACSYPTEKQSVLNPTPFKEEDVYPANPESAYGWSKLMGEYEAILAMEENKINVGILRLHNVYGINCELSQERSQVIPALIRKAINYPNEDFIVWGSGNQRRAFVHVDDVINALLELPLRGMNEGVIQIGPSESISIKEIAEIIVSVSGKKIPIRYDQSKPEGDIDRCANWDKARQVLGWEPKVNIKDGIKNVYKWVEMKLKGKHD
jgi:nucleoside-diphosphate-sugar epimerase